MFQVHRFDLFTVVYHTDVSKIDENRCKQTPASLPCCGTNRWSQFTVIMNLPQNTAYACGSEYVIFT